MAFWSWQHGSRASTSEDSVTLESAWPLEPIQVFRADGELSGWIAARGQRVTDLLNASDTMRIQLDAIDQERWVDIERDSILVVAPPPHASQPQRRVHRQRRRVRAQVGPFEITGTAHLVPGAGLDPYLLRTRQAFLPMTDIVISRRDNPSWEHEAGVAIINVGNLSELHELLTLA